MSGDPETAAPSAGVDRRQVQTTAKGRLYHWKGEEYWSVTTLLKGLPAPQLVEWRVTKVAEAAVADWRKLGAMVEGTRIERITKRLPADVVGSIRSLFGLREGGPRGGQELADDLWIVRQDPNAIARAIRYLRDAPYAETKRKADLGTAIHDEIEAYINGTPRPTPPLIVARYMVQFRDFLDVIRPRFVAAEATVYNRTEAYAGRLDGLAYIGADPERDPDGRIIRETRPLYVIDWKSSRGIYPEVAYQLSAYSHAEFIGLPDGSEVLMPRVDAAAALHLTEDDWELVPAVIGEFWVRDARHDVFEDFKYIRENFDILERRSKGILGRPVKTRQALEFLAVGNQPTLQLVPDAAPLGVVELHAEAED